MQIQEQANQEFAHAVQRISRILRTGQWVAEFAAILILFAIPAFIAQWLVFLCIVLTLISWLWAQQYRLQIVLDFGQRHPQYLELLAKSYGLLSGMLLLCILYPNYYVAFRNYLSNADIAWVEFAFYAVFAIAILVTFVQYTRYCGRYYKSLAGKALREEIRRQLQQNGIDWTAWVIVFALTLFQLNVTPTLLGDAAVRGMAYVLLSTWFGYLVVKAIHILYWQRLLRRSAGTMHTSQNEKGGGI